MAAIQSAYMGLFQAYEKKIANRYDVHQKKELRDIYCKIVQLNKDAPIYKFRDKNNARSFAVAIKAHAHEIQNVVAFLSDANDGIKQTFHRKVAVSSQPQIADVFYTGNNHTDETGFLLEINQLATPQINTGNFLSVNNRSFSPGDYSFDLKTTSNSYEFQFYVASSDKNSDILSTISSLINQAHIGLNAQVLTNEKKQIALQIRSDTVGLPLNNTSQFKIQSGVSSASEYAVKKLGIDKVSHNATNAVYSVDGKTYMSSDNTCTVNSSFDVTLYNITSDHTPVQIGFKPDSDAIFDHIASLANSYNHMLETVHNCLPEGRNNSALLQDMRSLTQNRQELLDSFGLNISPDGHIILDKPQIVSTLESGNMKELYTTLTDFAKDLSKEANKVSLDPLRYLDPIIIIYKRPGHNQTSTYFTSLYAGLFCDQIC